MTSQAFDFGTPATTDQNDGDQLYVLATLWHADADGSWTGIEWRVPDSLAGNNHYMLAYDTDFTGNDDYLVSQAITPTPGGLQDFTFGAAQPIVAGHSYYACILTNHYVFTGSYAVPHTDGHLVATGFALGTTFPDLAKYPDTPTGTNFYISPIVSFSAGTVTGSAAANLGALTGAASGVRLKLGSGVGSLGRLIGLAIGSGPAATPGALEAAQEGTTLISSTVPSNVLVASLRGGSGA